MSSCGYNYDPLYKGPNSYGDPQSSMPSGPGCYARCLIPEQVSKEMKTYIVYTGDDLTAKHVVFRRIEISPEISEWEKIKSDKNCVSDNPDDCLVWSLKKVPEQFFEFYTVTDTIIEKNFKLQEVEHSYISEQKHFTDWVRIVCPNSITKKLYKNIQVSLIEKGFLSEGDATGIWGQDSNEALINFQKANYLGIGGFTYETMFALDVKGYWQ